MMRHFSRLIESHYRQHLPLAEYAKLIGLSVTHLNYLCREFYGCSALGVLHQRLMLEARRNLQYTRMTVTQLSDYLGFSDAAYFLAFSAATVVCRLKHLEKQLKRMLHNFQA